MGTKFPDLLDIRIAYEVQGSYGRQALQYESYNLRGPLRYSNPRFTNTEM